MIGSDIGSVIGGLINNGRSLPTIDVSQLLNTINANKATNTGMINNLPLELQALLAPYSSALNTAGTTLQGTTNDIGQNLLNSTQNLYGPNNPAVMATLAGLKQQDYSTLPGTLTALKANLAGSGGLNRGASARAIQSAVLAPASQYSQQAATVTGQQLQAQQQNVQAALNKIAALDDQTAQSLFGMSKEQATTILTSGRNDLKAQLSDLINANNSATGATLGAQGIQAQNAYQNALTNRAQQAAVTNGLVNLGVDAGTMAVSGLAGGGAGAGAGAFPQGDATVEGALPNPASSVPGMGSGGSGLNLY